MLLVGCCCGCQGAEVRPVAYVDEGLLGLKVDCQPEEAEVHIDGVLQGSCATLAKNKLVLKMAAGQHELMVAAPGFRTFRSQVSGNGMLQVLTVRLEPQGGL